MLYLVVVCNRKRFCILTLTVVKKHTKKFKKIKNKTKKIINASTIESKKKKKKKSLPAVNLQVHGCIHNWVFWNCSKIDAVKIKRVQKTVVNIQTRKSLKRINI